MYKVGFLEPCAGCGGFAEIETRSDYLILDAGHAEVGDIVRCTRCECAGVIRKGDEGLYCYWDDDLCEPCWAGMVHRIVHMIKTF